MLAEIQQSLFDVSLYGGKKIRGHYKKRDKNEIKQDAVKKIADLTPYAEFAEISAALANYLPVSLLNADCEAESKDYGLIIRREIHYTNEDYEYYGEIFRGENFKLIEAELKGTEKLKIDKRLYIHKKLLDLIKTGLNIHEAAELLQEEIKRLNNGENYTVDGN